MSSRRVRYPTRWSEWQWNEQYQRDARYRQVSKDKWEWQYKELPTEAQEFSQHVEPTLWTPRDRNADPPGDLEIIEEQGQRIDDQQPEPQDYQGENFRIASGGISGITQGLASTKIDDQQENEAQGKGKDVDVVHGKENYSGYPTPHSGTQVYHSGYAGSHSETGQGQSFSYPASQAGTAQDYHSSYAGSQSETSQDQPFQYPASQSRPAETYNPQYPASQQFNSHAALPAQHDNHPATGWGVPHSVSRPANQSWGGSQMRSNRRMVRTKNENTKYDELDSRFTVHNSSYFKFGKIFKVLWSEPRGSGGTEITAMFGEKAFHKIRRFLVIKTRKGKGHSTCIPILTYGGQGTLKYGADPEDHAVVYTSKPQYIEGEDRIIKKPVRIELKDPKEKLDPTSRLNYGKIYTVEHNVKVFFIGQVARNHEQTVATDFNKTHPPIEDRPHSERPGSPDFSHAGQADPDYPSAAVAIPPSTSWSSSGASYPVSSSHPGATLYPYSAPGNQPYTHPLVFSREPQVSSRAAEQSPQDDHDQATAGDVYDSSLYEA